jgi:hypothetical protein
VGRGADQVAGGGHGGGGNGQAGGGHNGAGPGEGNQGGEEQEGLEYQKINRLININTN